jgi:hypothetical protein
MNRALLEEVAAERDRQTLKWGNAPVESSVRGEVARFGELLIAYVMWAVTMTKMNSYDRARRRLIQVAAMALACVEFIDSEGKGKDRLKVEEQPPKYIRFTVDGLEFDYPDAAMMGDGNYPPFKVFDAERQSYVRGESMSSSIYCFMRREQAQAVADALNAAELYSDAG